MLEAQQVTKETNMAITLKQPEKIEATFRIVTPMFMWRALNWENNHEIS